MSETPGCCFLRAYEACHPLLFGIQISNSWLAVAGALVTGIANGGAVIFIWGTWLMFAIHLAIGASLGELASAYPNSGMSYHDSN